jgi:hypothetical protein
MPMDALERHLKMLHKISRKLLLQVRFLVLMTAYIKMTVFWNIALGGLTEIDQRPNNAGRKHL